MSVEKTVKKTVKPVVQNMVADAGTKVRKKVGDLNSKASAVDKVSASGAEGISKQKKAKLSTNGNLGLQSSAKAYSVDSTIYATGRRKSASARVFCNTNHGVNDSVSIVVNDRVLNDYFCDELYQNVIKTPLAFLQINSGYNFIVTVSGGGISGQADAIKLGISKCLALVSDSYRVSLRKSGFLTRDSRVVESKKAGYRKARKKEQFSKR